jgi:Zn-dependent protease
MNELIQTIAVYALPVLFAITLHEAAHAYAAKYFGDATAFLAGRMSLNPIKHIDPMGTIVIPIMLYILTNGNFIFGYAKPVPVDFGNLRNPKKQMAWVALAGPASNFAMALGWLIASKLLFALSGDDSFFTFLWKMAEAGVLVNILMFAFNLLPIPPLDGGRIMTSILPQRYAYKFAKIEPYGFFIVLGLLLLKVLPILVVPMMVFTSAMLHLLVLPLTLLLN